MTDASVTKLTPSDHTYLHLDTASSPMHWAMLLELSADGNHLKIGDVRERVRERSELFELFRLGIDRGRWRRPREVVAEKVDADSHLAAAEYTDAAELSTQVTALLETPLPRPRPERGVGRSRPTPAGRPHTRCSPAGRGCGPRSAWCR